MALDIALTPVERLLFSSDIVALGTFRCGCSHPLFEDSGPCNSNAIVFPRVAVEIEHLRGPKFVADSTIVPLYNRGQAYRRKAISPADNSDWLVLADDVLAEIVDPLHANPAASAAGSGRLFRSPFQVSDGRTFLAQREIFELLLSNVEADPLQIEEAALNVGASVLRRGEHRIDAIRRPDLEIVNNVKGNVARRLAAKQSLGRLAASAGVSPYRLCRLFKSASGMTLTKYRHSLRLRTALARIRRTADLAELALDLGFTSHSHFTALFRRHFGITPMQYRGRRPMVVYRSSPRRALSHSSASAIA